MQNEAQHPLTAEINRLRQMEKEFQKVEKRYRYFAEQTAEGFYRMECSEPIPVNLPADEIVNRMYQYCYIAECNDIYAQTYGLTAEQMKGERLVTLHGGAHDPKNRTHLLSFVGSGFRATKEETREYDDRGTEIFLENNSVGIIENGLLVTVWGTQRNITEAKHAEDEREALKAQLHQAQKMEAVGRLVGGVAHDFNNMLSVVNGYAQLTKDRLDAGDPLREYLDEILLAAEKSTDLIRQLLTFAKKQIVEAKVVNLNETLHESHRFLGRLLGEDINIKFIYAPDLWLVHIAPSQIDQILANLLINARDAIAGTGTVTVEIKNVASDQEPSHTQRAMKPGEYVRLRVSDSGIGMGKEQLEHLFEPFYTTKKKGTGLGLSTVYGIVEQNEGVIDVDSKLGQGTTFTIYLPRYTGPSEPFKKPIPMTPELHTRTILLVDDEPKILTLCRHMLEGQDYTILTASRPEDAITLCREHEGGIDLLVTDIILPEMSGKALNDRLTAMRPNLRTLYMSGYTADIVTPHGIFTEGASFMQKPFTRESLIAKITEMLSR